MVEAPAPVTEAAAAPAPSPATLPSPNFEFDFSEAKRSFVNGDFPLAYRKFDELSRSAREPLEQARIEGMLEASRTWSSKTLVLVEQGELEGSDVMSRRTDRRTADEIGALYLSSIVYGLGTGLWLDFITEPTSVAGAILPPLFLAGAAAGGVALIDSGRGLRYGTAQSISAGMSLGFFHGSSWGTYYQATASSGDQLDVDQYVTLLWGSTTAGAVAGGLIGTLNSTTPGRAAFVSSTTLWSGTILGLGVAGTTADDDGLDDRSFLGAAFGATAGTVGGILAAGSVAPTTARVRFLDLGAVAGGLAVGGLTLAAVAEDTDSGQEVLLATDLGIVGGLLLAWWLTEDMPKDLGAPTPQKSAFSLTPTVFPRPEGPLLGAVGTF